MKRRDDWLVRLTEKLAEFDAGMEPDKINCANFIGEVIEAMTDENPMAEFAGMTIEDQLEKLQADHGTSDPLIYACSRLEEIPKNYASVGDIAVFKGADLPIFGVVIGDMARVFTLEGLPGNLPVARAHKVLKL